MMENKNQIDSIFKLRVRQQYDLRLKNRTASIKAKNEINGLKIMMHQILELQKPVTKFFDNLQKKPAPSRMNKAEKEAMEDEAIDAAIAAKALKRLTKKGL